MSLRLQEVDQGRGEPPNWRLKREDLPSAQVQEEWASPGEVPSRHQEATAERAFAVEVLGGLASVAETEVKS